MSNWRRHVSAELKKLVAHEARWELNALQSMVARREVCSYQMTS